MKITNIEIKAKTDKPDKIRTILKAGKAYFAGTDYQTDTYFNVNRGRLKLREGNIEKALIYYKRENRRGPKKSDVKLFKTGCIPELKNLLEKSLGVLVAVKKAREIYFVDNVKFHIDSVEGLGTFVEIEAIDKTGTLGINHLKNQCEQYMDLFGIGNDELVEVSYSDLLLMKRNWNK